MGPFPLSCGASRIVNFVAMDCLCCVVMLRIVCVSLVIVSDYARHDLRVEIVIVVV